MDRNVTHFGPVRHTEMDLIAYLEAKAARCRALAARENGDVARMLLDMAAQYEADKTTLAARYLSAVRRTRENLIAEARSKHRSGR
jgi:hypothetical protein